MPVNTLLQMRRGTAATWTSTDPTLSAGEWGYETDTGRAKIGDGLTAWTSLKYATLRYNDLITGSGVSITQLTDGNSQVTGLSFSTDLAAGSNITLSESGGTITINGEAGITLSEGTGIHIVTAGANNEINVSGLTHNNILDFDEAVDARVTAASISAEEVMDVVGTGVFGVSGVGINYKDAENRLEFGVSSINLTQVGDVTATATEVNYLDGTTLGTATASNVLAVDANKDISSIRNLTIDGDLTVNGTTTTVNSTVVTIEDPVFVIGSGSPTSDDNKDRGIEFNYHNGSVAKVGYFGFDDSTGKFTFIPDATNTNEVFSGSVGEIDANLDWSNLLNISIDDADISAAAAINVAKLSASGITLGTTSINLGESSTTASGLTQLAGTSAGNPVYLWYAVVDGGSPQLTSLVWQLLYSKIYSYRIHQWQSII